jgi:hypothetical protein
MIRLGQRVDTAQRKIGLNALLLSLCVGVPQARQLVSTTPLTLAIPPRRRQ